MVKMAIKRIPPLSVRQFCSILSSFGRTGIYTADLSGADRAGKSITLISFTDILSLSGKSKHDTCVDTNIYIHLYASR